MLALTPAPQLIVVSTRNRREVGELIGSLARADVHRGCAPYWSASYADPGFNL
jgi:hypothetical protein